MPYGVVVGSKRSPAMNPLETNPEPFFSSKSQFQRKCLENMERPAPVIVNVVISLQMAILEYLQESISEKSFHIYCTDTIFGRHNCLLECVVLGGLVCYPPKPNPLSFLVNSNQRLDCRSATLR